MKPETLQPVIHPGPHELDAVQKQIAIQTTGRGLIEITGRVADAVRRYGGQSGLCHLFIRHTSASLLVMENADPDVLRDLETFISGLAPDGDPRLVHTAEGPDDMPAHIRSMLTSTALGIPVIDGRLALGTWQGIFLWEHRHRGQRREIVLTII